MTEESFLHDMTGFVRRFDLFREKDNILIAVSGGIDSMVLLDVLSRLKERFHVALGVAHVNYGLRGAESDADEQLVRDTSAELGLGCHVDRLTPEESAKLARGSLQQDARAIRYTFFRGLMDSLHYTRTATAHHADDNAETVLFNFLRGSGVHGLSGIPVSRNDAAIIRPLLFATRAEIASYARSRGVRYREDSSNRKSDYARNFLRNNIIPGLKGHINPGLTATLSRSSELFRRLESFLDDEACALEHRVVTSRTNDEIVIDIDGLLSASEFLRDYLLLKTAREFTGRESDSSSQVRSMTDVLAGETGARCAIGAGAVVLRDRKRLLFLRQAAAEPFFYPVECGRDYDFEGFRFSSHDVPAAEFSTNPRVEYADARALIGRLALRTWRKGDWFIPLGMKEKKKLSDFFVEQKVPLTEKARIPLLESDGSIVWVLGKRLDERSKVTPATERIIKLDYEPRT